VSQTFALRVWAQRRRRRHNYPRNYTREHSHDSGRILKRIQRLLVQHEEAGAEITTNELRALIEGRNIDSGAENLEQRTQVTLSTDLLDAFPAGPGMRGSFVRRAIAGAEQDELAKCDWFALKVLREHCEALTIRMTSVMFDHLKTQSLSSGRMVSEIVEARCWLYLSRHAEIHSTSDSPGDPSALQNRYADLVPFYQ